MDIQSKSSIGSYIDLKAAMDLARQRNSSLNVNSAKRTESTIKNKPSVSVPVVSSDSLLGKAYGLTVKTPQETIRVGSRFDAYA